MLNADRFSRVAALRPTRSVVQRPPSLRAPNEDDAFARLLGAGIANNHFGDHAVIRNWYSTPEFSEPSPIALDLLTRQRDTALSGRTRAALADPTKWLFLDTETTGIAGGTGTYAFLIGLAWWDAGGLHVEQLFMRDFAEEHSILHELAARLAERPVLITFNGKSFDWPLLESRFTMTRAIAVPRLAAHLDLLHPARSLWKLRLGSVRLVELERHVLDPVRLGWSRDTDISSAQIPQHYFDYLRGGPLDPLAGVVRHNQMDLRGLAALFGKIDTLLAAETLAADEIHSLDLFGLSRFLQRRGDPNRAHSACSQALDWGLPSEFSPQARRELAQMAKRRGEHENAAALWHDLVANASADDHHAIHACEQLAIHYERRAKDPARALEFAKLALAKLCRTRTNPGDLTATARTTRLAQKLLNRVERLEHRMRSGDRVLSLPLRNSGSRPKRLGGHLTG
jgi:uncharacterized protein YprB with RNaseH-like and TPR domain